MRARWGFFALVLCVFGVNEACSKAGPAVPNPRAEVLASQPSTVAGTSTTSAILARTSTVSGLHLLPESLAAAQVAWQTGGLKGAKTFGRAHGLQMDKGRVRVQIGIRNVDAASSVKAVIAGLGGEVDVHFDDVLYAWVPVGQLGQLALEDDVLGLLANQAETRPLDQEP